MADPLSPQIEEGIRLLQSGQFAAAETHFRKLLSANLNHPHIIHLTGLVLHRARRDPAAIDLVRRSIDLSPNNPDYLMNLGNVYLEQNRVDDAIESFRRSVQLRPEHAPTLTNLGNALRAAGRFAEAIDSYQAALRINPRLAQTHSLLGNALRETGNIQAAANAHRQAIAVNPRFVGAYVNLGAALHDMGSLDEAVATYQAGLAIDPNAADLWTNLSAVQREIGNLDIAVASGHRATVLAPKSPAAWNNFGTALMHQGRIEDAVTAFREAIRLAPQFVPPWDNMLFALNYRTKWDSAAILREHKKYQDTVAPTSVPPVRDRIPDRKLKIGYISADLRNHPVGRFLLPLLKYRDRERFEVFAYANHPANDDVTHKIRACVDHFHNIHTLPNPKLDALIRSHEIDILIDLAGHTANNRLPVFARKPAPVQITWLGYPATTGLTSMDYRITDELADPSHAAVAACTETLIRLPACFLCFDPPADAPDVSPPLCLSKDFITFGSFNNFAKVSPETAALWARVLNAMPSSRLIIKSRGLSDPGTANLVRDALSSAGADLSRIEIRSHTPGFREHLAAYGEIDVALDTFPYNGTTTTCEALWMGVPVITLSGSTHASRVGTSLLVNANLGEWATDEPDAYVERAQDIASNRARLAEIRQSLRSTLRESPLCNARRFAPDFEQALRTVWHQYCGRK